MPVTSLSVRSRIRDYTVDIVEGPGWCRELATLSHAFVVVDENVWRLHGAGLLAPLRDCGVVTLPVAEDRKDFSAVQRLLDVVTERAVKRSTVVVSIGGGITQDVTGFLASVLYRGVEWVYVPTTVLAMADSCIGAKTSLNHGAHKNLIGTMYPPERVVVDPSFVHTLARRDYLSGLGEMAKLAILGGPGEVEAFRARLDPLLKREETAVRDATRTALETKRRFIEEDEFDRGRRVMLNFGHCFGHAIETATGFAVPHGQAVVLGMLAAGSLAVARGIQSGDLAGRLRRELLLPLLHPDIRLGALQAEPILDAMRYDKKRTGAGLAVVMIDDALEPRLADDVSEAETLQALDRLAEILQP